MPASGLPAPHAGNLPSLVPVAPAFAAARLRRPGESLRSISGDTCRRATQVGSPSGTVTALLLSGARLFFDPRPEAHDAGFFLLAVSFLTGNAVSTGVRVLRFKKRATPHLHWWDVGLPVVLTVFSVALGVYGIWRGNVLFMAFSVIGLLSGGGALRYWLRAPGSHMHWWFEHMGSMLGGCIAATTAFLVVNANNLGLWPMAAWLAPSIIGTPATVIWTAYYRRRFSGSPSSRSYTSSAAPAAVPRTLSHSA